MSRAMDCFKWQTHASEYLDGTLIGGAKREADEHLESCGKCAERHRHYRLILSTIAGQPRSSLPIPIRKSPLASVLPRLELALFGRSRWEQIPWAIRTVIEGTGIVLLILSGISLGPKIRTLYEKSIERRLSEFADPLNADEYALDEAQLQAPPLARGAAPVTEEEFVSGDTEDDGEEADLAEQVAGNGTEKGDVRVGNSEVWRFNLKTDSRHEFRRKIVKVLQDLSIPATTPGLGGIEVPGGIQFDLELAQSVVPGLKRQLESIAPTAPAELANTPVGETFTWYKNKSKRKLPEGKARVIIWLSQM